MKLRRLDKRDEPMLIKFFYVVFVLIVIAYAFDIAVTYHEYKTDRNSFFLREANRKLVAELIIGVSFFLTSQFWLMITGLLAIFFYIQWFMFTFKSTYIKYIVVLALTVILAVKAGMHIAGGLSWLI